MSTNDDGSNDFLSRWSRRKRGATEPATTADPSDASASQAEAASQAQEAGAVDVSQLPDIEDLSADSDFTPFLREGVPEALKRRALRKLWGLDPVFANLDGLNDYDLDYTNAATVVENLKTAYRAGRGYADDEPREPVNETAENTDEPPAAAPETAGTTDGENASAGDGETGETDTISTEPTAPVVSHVVEPDPEPKRSSPRPETGQRRQGGSAAKRRWGVMDAGSDA